MKTRVAKMTPMTHKDAAGTAFIGHLTGVTYAELTNLFGSPLGTTSDGKVRAQWIIRFTDGLVATIYDYKEDRPLATLTEWNIGGNNHQAWNRINAMLRGL